MKAILLAISLVVIGGGTAVAASCTDWKATCLSRGGGAACAAKFAKCMKTGTFTEGAAYGGATHSNLTKK